MNLYPLVREAIKVLCRPVRRPMFNSESVLKLNVINKCIKLILNRKCRKFKLKVFIYQIFTEATRYEIDRIEKLNLLTEDKIKILDFASL